MEYEHIVHGFEPIYDQHSRVLILGSLPSVKSREQSFYYGHPQNRFWRVLAAVCGCETPSSVEEKKRFLLSNRIALWDVIAECDIIGSSDSAIRNAVPTDIMPVLSGSDIRCIFVNGAAACKIYDRYHKPLTGRDAVRLPSTSPANAAYCFDRLLSNWSVIAQYI